MKTNKYEQNLINSATRLDTVLNQDSICVKCVFEILQGENIEFPIKKLFSLILQIANEKNRKAIENSINLKNALLLYLGYQKVLNIIDNDIANDPLQKLTLEGLMEELNNLVGLANVKSKVNDLIAYQKVQKKRKELSLNHPKSTLHLAFTGNPGTGKTTVARIIGRIYKRLGLLSKGHFIEASRTDLIAGYQGQTAMKVKKVIERSRGGVLFIDEAYSITENEHSDSYGRECITELTKALEDYRDDLVVIVAGYTEPMKHFFESNPGLRSRFNTFIEFGDYNSDELFQILRSMCDQNDYRLSDDAEKMIKQIIDKSVEVKEKQFANGRFIRNLFEDMVMNHARRVALLQSPSLEDLKDIIICDISE